MRAFLIAAALFAGGCLGAPTADSAPPDPADPAVPPAVPPGAPAPVIGGDGTFAVGTEIAPGTYISAGPAPEGPCYWRRVGAGDTTLANAMSRQPQVVRIDATDVAFTTDSCQPWQRDDAAALPGETPPWLAQLQLRGYLDQLNALAGQSGNGQLPP